MDFEPVESGGFLIGDDGSLGGFEALRLVRFVFRGVIGRSRQERMVVLVWEGDLSPLPGLGVHGGTEPSAHALGYRLTALQAWGHGLGRPEVAEVYRDRTRFFSVSF